MPLHRTFTIPTYSVRTRYFYDFWGNKDPLQLPFGPPEGGYTAVVPVYES